MRIAMGMSFLQRLEGPLSRLVFLTPRLYRSSRRGKLAQDGPPSASEVLPKSARWIAWHALGKAGYRHQSLQRC